MRINFIILYNLMFQELLINRVMLNYKIVSEFQNHILRLTKIKLPPPYAVDLTRINKLYNKV
ncbi:MAG: hypothetical protein A2X61_00355 [Ignavibacteria bacterium GWB2_35_12]|nr:MAG: hypothetical protein A2X63_02160 [Ignavibacteria bacterium GWA2_35_8]OGU41744.1 MAG: hypothetical protein A2X61_00355 [Ignavibacteria bacterium GWB2_35_12]